MKYTFLSFYRWIYVKYVSNPKIKQLGYIIALSILAVGCSDSNSKASVNSFDNNQSENIDSLDIDLNSEYDIYQTNIFTNSKIEASLYTIEGETHEGHPSIVKDSLRNPSLVLEISWTPKNTNTEQTTENKNYNPDYLHPRHIYLEVIDTSKITMGVNYPIRSEYFKIKGVFHGLLSNFELYKDLNGEVQFNELDHLGSKLKILLKGELNEMRQTGNDTILYGEIIVTKEKPEVQVDEDELFRTVEMNTFISEDDSVFKSWKSKQKSSK